MVDRDDDVHLGIHSSALLLGKYDVVAVMSCYAMSLLLLWQFGRVTGLGYVYFAGLVAAAGIALYHFQLIRHRARENCFKAFLHNNWLGAAIFAGIAGDYLLQ
jgi:4-hydroxybenzoate polyprenyltransferase